MTIQWPFGSVGCKAYKFVSAFGFYLSSLVTVCIALDRYFAVAHPLRVSSAKGRGRAMLLGAWLLSTVISLPQVKI